MTQILNRIPNLDANDSDAVKEALTVFFQNLPKHTGTDCYRWLCALENIVTRFPKYCSQHRNTIELYLAKFLDSTNYYNAIEAAKCGHALQQIRPSQDKAATPKNCWREQMGLLCNTAHTLIEAIFSKTVNIYKNTRKTQNFEAKLLANAPLTAAFSNILNVNNTEDYTTNDKKTLLCTRLRNIFVFIQAMIVEIYPVAKPIQPQLILEVIVQAISVSSSVNTDVSDAGMVKTQALKTLDALVACLGSNLIPFSALVFRFVMQTLRWSGDNPSDESRKVRCSAYGTLDRWLTVLHSHRVAGDSRGRSWEEELTQHIIQDVTPPKKIVQLTMSNQPTKNLSKKAKRKLANSMLQQSVIASHMPGEKNKIIVSEEINDDVANAALECTETFMTVCGIFLKPTTHKLFQERLVRECYGMEGYTAERGLRLLRALEACRKNTPPTVPPPTQYCLQLHSTLTNSRYDQIKKFCSQAILDIRLHLHCSPPSLTFDVDVQPEKSKADDKRKRVSEKNRAALESLLGTERMPEVTIEEEVITIPDEPANKKPRTEEDTDKISLSSESVNSIEISDESGTEDTAEQEVQIVVAEAEETDTPAIEINIDPVIENQSDSEMGNVDSSEPSGNKTIDINGDANEKEQTDARVKEKETASDKNDIFNATTQIDVNISHDTEEGDKSPVSMEVAYDLPNTNSTGKVAVLEKLDDDNLPSTNDTDDIQITCGQTVKDSQDVEMDKNKVVTEDITVNGDIVVNGVVHEGENKEDVESKKVNVDDMLADFVDEVIEESVTPA